MAAQWYDANTSIPGCDKNMPGCAIAMGRLNRPGLMVYGGTIRAGDHGGQKLDVVSAFQSYGQFISHAIARKIGALRESVTAALATTLDQGKRRGHDLPTGVRGLEEK